MQNVTLRQLSMADKIPLQQLANNINIARNLRTGFPHPYTLEDAETFITKNLEPQEKAVIRVFRAIKCNNEFTGMTGLHNIKDGKAELGYWLGEPYWGKGIMTKAVKAILETGQKAHNLKQVFAYTFVTNPGSEKVLLNNGFKKLKTVDEDCNDYQKGVLSHYFEYDY